MILEPKQREELEKRVNETIDWIYDSGKQMPALVDYTSRLEYFERMYN
jgi:hypothetical protein